MNLDDLRSKLGDPSAISEDPFGILSAVIAHHNENPESPESQELVLRTLEYRDVLNGFESMLDALVREHGLFPYLTPGNLSDIDRIAYEYHTPSGLAQTGIVFHRPQARVFRELDAGKSVILSAPTSFGKSLIIDAVVASERHRNILIVVPTIALIDETRRRIADLGANYRVITHQTQNAADRNIYVLTQERALDYSDLDVDFLVIDEFYKLSPQRGDDERSALLNQVFYRIAKKGVQFYLLGPSVTGVAPDVVDRLECTFIYERFATVVSELHRVTEWQDEIVELAKLCQEIEGPTMIFCRSPNRAAKVSAALAEHLDASEGSCATDAVEWLGREYHEDWHVTKALASGIGVHHGRVPRAVAQYIVRAFDQDVVRFLVCTSTLIEGVNTKAKNIVILDNTISLQEIDHFTFNNIRGRSGRMFKHFVGHVYMFHPPPPEQLPFIDVPAYSLSEYASDSLLLQIDESDLREPATSRVKELTQQGILSAATLRANSGIDPLAQIAVAETVIEDLDRFEAIFNWNRYPNYSQLKGICELIWQHFNGRALGSGSVLTAPQLAFRVNQLSSKPTVRELIDRQIGFLSKRSDNVDIDSAVQSVLDFLRLWANFHFPRLLRGIDRIQKEIMPRQNRPSGDFLYYAGQVEHYFLDPVLVALEEYGIPLQTARALENQVLVPGDLDETIARLKTIDLHRVQVHEFEKGMVENAISVGT